MKVDLGKIILNLAAGALIALSSTGYAQPRWGAESSPSPSTSTSQKTNEAADKALYKPVEYSNAGKAGPPLIVIPGEIKSNNATFTQKFGTNNIADFAEIELSKANFPVLERTNLGPLLNEFTLAYNLGDPDAARKMLGRGKLKTTKWVVKFDILKTEQVASAQKGFDGATVGRMIGIFGGTGAAVGGTAVGSVTIRASTSRARRAAGKISCSSATTLSSNRSRSPPSSPREALMTTWQ